MATAASRETGGNGEVTTAAGKCDAELTTMPTTFPSNFAETVASLPQGPQCPMFPSLRLFHGFWLPEITLLNLPQIHARFNASPTGDDILVASFPKSGTTWLKSVCYAAARRAAHPPSSDNNDHPLLSRNSHDCVRSLDTLQFLQPDKDGEAAATPRLVGTHLPYSLLPARATADGCRIVYICRDPKDTLVSLWHFNSGIELLADQGQGQGTHLPPAPAASSFEEVFEQFCGGRYGLGPQWEHAREYWEASRRSPEKVLFLRYEEMLADPAGSLKKLAAFMGCPFSAAEEDAGVVRDILDLCSIERQRSLPVNRDGAYVVQGLLRIGNRNFFRKGVPGDWRNHMTPDMAARLDGVVEEALKGTGFTFAADVHTC